MKNSNALNTIKKLYLKENKNKTMSTSSLNAVGLLNYM